MQKYLASLFLLLVVFIGTCISNTVYLIRVDGTINPAASSFIERGIKTATDKQGECLIIELNTPGGLLESTRIIVRNILESDIPIVVYVSPAGSRAGSAGVFITLAANIAAMAPGTNIGAAHPVSAEGKMDSVMNEKATNDAAAFIRTIAEKRNRNLKWAEDAVRKSQSITETEAIKNNIIDIIAKNRDELLSFLEGKETETKNGKKILHTKDAKIEVIEMGWIEKLLDILSNPNIALILFQIGVIGLVVELYNPGAIFPGVVGVISLILAFYSMHTLPINYAGLALIIFGIILFLLEIKIVSHGMLAIGGAISLFLGSIMLIEPSSILELAEVSLSVVIAVVVVSTIFFVFILGYGIKALRSKPSMGTEGMAGETGEAITDIDPLGTVSVHGEIWKAETIGEKINKGDKIIVKGIEKLKLKVERLTK